jgi:hypothetical protein
VDGATRTAQFSGGLVIRFPFEVTKHHGGTVLIRQQADFLIKQQSQIARIQIGILSSGNPLFRQRQAASLSGQCLSLQSYPVCYFVKPTREGFFSLDASRPTNEDEERRLKGVLSILRMAQNAAANMPDHLRMPPDKRLEGRLVSVQNESPEQIAVRKDTR